MLQAKILISRHNVALIIENWNLSIVGWQVPNNDILEQYPFLLFFNWTNFVNAPAGWRISDIERRLFVIVDMWKEACTDSDFFICDLSNLVTIYKGLCM